MMLYFALKSRITPNATQRPVEMLPGVVKPLGIMYSYNANDKTESHAISTRSHFLKRSRLAKKDFPI